MPITDGSLNVFRLSAADPIQQPDADLRATHELFGGAGPESWLATTVDDALAVMDETGVERALLTASLGGVARAGSLQLGDVVFGTAACARAPERFRLVLQLQDVSS